MTKTRVAERLHSYMTDAPDLLRRTREHLNQGAVARSVKADPKAAIRVLNDTLATWCVCILQYKRHYDMASGIHSRHGSAPDLSLATRSHSRYAEGRSLLGMMREDLVAQRIAVESYTAIIRYLGDDDATTCNLMGRILCTGEERAEEMNLLLESLDEDVHLATCA